MNDHYFENLFKKYLSVQCTPDEINELFRLIGKKQYQDILDYLIAEELSKNVSERLPLINEDKAIEKVKSVLLGEIRAQIPAKSNKVKSLFDISKSWLKNAAVWLLIGSATLLLFHGHFTDQHDVQIKHSTRQLITKNGQRKFIKLFDGTKIWLSPSSTLHYQDQLINSFREVTLDGEAFFEVAKDKEHPFIIHSGRMQTEVVGTSFNVKSYSTQNIFNVTVVTGIVRVSMLSSQKNKLSELILKPKHQAIYNNAKATLADKSIAAVDAVVKKRDGILGYDGMPVPDVIADFRRYYNQEIELQNKSSTCLCYGEFDLNRPINIVLRQLAAAIGATVRQTEKGYILEGGCSDK